MQPLHILLSKKPDKAPRVGSLYLKLRSRFTAYFFLLVLLPYIVIAATAYFHVRSIAEKDAYDLACTSIEQEKASIERHIDELELATGASVISVKSVLRGAWDETGSNRELAALLKNTIEKNLTPAQLDTLSAAFIIDENGIKASYGSEADTAAISSPASQQWFYSTVTNPGTVQKLGTMQRFYAEGKSKIVFCMAQAIQGSNGPDSGTVLLFDFSYSLLEGFASNAVPAGKVAPERLIIDFAGNILYSRDHGKLTAAVDTTIADAMDSGDSGFKPIYFGSRSYYMTYIRYSDLAWTFIDLNPAENVSEGLWLRDPIMAVCIFALPVILFIFMALILRLLNPINELTTVISDYESQLPGVSGQTTLLRDRLPNTGVGAISDIDFLINKIYNIKLRQKEAELNSLQNQINPHFLYNTLESIRGAALYHGIHDIAAMSKALSLLFRYSISDRVLVSIKEELQHLENYMSIQNFRYENKFELVCSVSAELMNYKILKLTLQPLIENSIKHGLEMKLGKGVVKIEILTLDNNIKIQISDDGLGIPLKKVEELNRSIAYERYLSGGETDRSGTGIGVKNVNSRIKLYFGQQYGLKFREALVGTTVEITLPAVMDN